MQKKQNKIKTEKFKTGYQIVETKDKETPFEVKEIKYRPVWYLQQTVEIIKIQLANKREVFGKLEQATATMALWTAEIALNKDKPKKWWQIWK